MPWQAIVELIQIPLWAFFCVLARLSPLLMLTPPIRGSGVPMRVRALLAIAMSATLTPLVFSTSSDVPVGLTQMTIRLVGEVAFGAVLGVSALVIIHALQSGSQIASNLAGLDMAEISDPVSGQSTNVLSQLFSWLAIAIYLIMGGHRQLFVTFLDSFDLFAMGSVVPHEGWLLRGTDLVQEGLEVGLRAIAPIAIALFVANLTTALLGRTLPQLGIMSIGFNVNALVLIGAIALTVGSVGWVFESELARWLEQTAGFTSQLSLPSRGP